MMQFNIETCKLESASGYIHALDDSLYTDYAIYLGKFDSPDNYEEGDADGFAEWNSCKDAEEPVS